MGLIKVRNGVIDDTEGKVKLHTDVFHIHSEEIELERYQAANGVITNFMQKVEVGTGTVTETVHSIDLSTGITAGVAEADYGVSSWGHVLDENDLIVNFRLKDFVVGVGTGMSAAIGLFAVAGESIVFLMTGGGSWFAYVHDGTTAYSKAVTIVDGDELTISADKYRQTFYVNGVKVWETFRSNLIASYEPLCVVSCTSTTTAREIKIDNFELMLVAKPSRPKKL